MRLPDVSRNVGFRFAAAHTGLFVLCVILIGLYCGHIITARLLEEASHRVMGEIGALASELEVEGATELRLAIDSKLAHPYRRLRYGLWDLEGARIVGDPGIDGLRDATPPGPETRASARPDPATGRSMLVAQRQVGPYRLLVADDLDSVAAVEAVFHRALMVALGLACVFGPGAGLLMAFSLLRRVERVSRAAEAIIAGDLGRRIEVTGSGDDFDRLSITLNRMLERISDLMDNLRQVSSDIAHDLRTPLSHLRQRLESARSLSRSVADYERAIGLAIKDVEAVLVTFTALLRISQVEAGLRRSSFKPLDLSETATMVAEAYGPALEDAGCRLRLEIAAGLVLEGDQDLIQQLIANLIENVLAHASGGGRLDIALATSGDGAELRVSDQGPGIPVAERAKVLRRFYRLERSRTTRGNGLGLALVAAIAELHAATLNLGDNAPGLVVSIRFPASPAPSGEKRMRLR